jgi:preprotein translocase subunit SecY
MLIFLTYLVILFTHRYKYLVIRTKKKKKKQLHVAGMFSHGLRKVRALKWSIDNLNLFVKKN